MLFLIPLPPHSLSLHLSLYNCFPWLKSFCSNPWLQTSCRFIESNECNFSEKNSTLLKSYRIIRNTNFSIFIYHTGFVTSVPLWWTVNPVDKLVNTLCAFTENDFFIWTNFFSYWSRLLFFMKSQFCRFF